MKRRSKPLRGTGLLLVVLVVVACGDSSDDPAASATTEPPPATTTAAPTTTVAAADPAATLEAYVAAYNAGDIDAVMALFSEDSVVIDHPITKDGTVTRGLDRIRQVHVIDLNAAADENAYTISNVSVTGDTVTWDHIWMSNDGEEFCKYGHRAFVRGGKFVTWTWPDGVGECISD